jgi:8-oxo-dGTP pyrophosphatase MutT (NUDIX family)
MKLKVESADTAMIEVIARAVIIDKNTQKVLFCATKNRSHYYLPGGHIEFGETAAFALRREIQEEINIDIPEDNFTFAGASENFFEQEGKSHHEVNFFFRAEISLDKNIQSAEEHIIFEWVSFEEFSKTPILPTSLIPMLKKWITGSEVIWNA